MVRALLPAVAVAAIAASVTAVAGQPVAETVRVELSSFSFTPDVVRVPLNRPVTLVITNISGGGHNFSAPQFFSAAEISSADAGQIKKGAIEVPKHGQVTIHLTIDKPGRYRLKCTHFLHAGFGMKGEVIVA